VPLSVYPIQRSIQGVSQQLSLHSLNPIQTAIYQPMTAHIVSNKTFLKHFKTLRHVSILSDHHQGALFLAKVILQYSQFSWYLQTRRCGSIYCVVWECVVEQWLGVRRTVSNKSVLKCFKSVLCEIICAFVGSQIEVILQKCTVLQ